MTTQDLNLGDLADEMLRLLQSRGCTPETAAKALTLALAALAMPVNRDNVVGNLRRVMARMARLKALNWETVQ